MVSLHDIKDYVVNTHNKDGWILTLYKDMMQSNIRTLDTSNKMKSKLVAVFFFRFSKSNAILFHLCISNYYENSVNLCIRHLQLYEIYCWTMNQNKLMIQNNPSGIFSSHTRHMDCRLGRVRRQ